MKVVEPRVAVFISFSGQGGVERMITNLVQGFLDAGIEVDMVIARARGDHLASIPDGVRQIRLGSRHTFTALPGLVHYLKKQKPDALLAVKDRGIKVAILARFLSGFKGRLAGRIGTTVSEAISGKGRLRKWFWYSGMRLFYPASDHIVAVSNGVADNIRTITGLPASRITVVPNPVITERMITQSLEPVDHPWFNHREIPVIMGMGRLTEQKDFATLIRAFSRVKSQLPCRLFIPGEGSKRGELEALIADLGLKEDVDLPGFLKNPYPFLRLSSLFVLSSRWEGSPNVLTEAMSLGVPVVSTDCRSGPKEVLEEGRYGQLVPVGDHRSLADAMVRTLRNPLPGETIKEAVSEYTVPKSVTGYLKALGLSGA